MSYTSPTLSYVSSVDVTSAVNEGLTKYQILFDASLVTQGNLIMFEYKLQTYGTTVPDLSNTTFGFISVEDAIQSGIQNQYVIAVPALANTYNGSDSVDNTIQVRVYFGITASSSNVFVSSWSNALDVHDPPVQPTIYTEPGFSGAYYDPDYTTDRLYVLLDPVVNPYDYDAMKFVVCYFYQDGSNATVWNVSDPSGTTTTSFGSQTLRLITVENIGTVSLTSPYVYVSIHAVYDWADGSNNYYSVSYMSNEVVAVSASSDNKPDITDVSYNVYNTPLPGDQTMTVTWTPPGNSTLPPYEVDYYELYYALDGSSGFTLYETDISSNTTSWTVDVGSTGLNLACGQSIVYRVDAITVNATVEPSDPSVSTNIFYYSQAVDNLVVTNTSYDPNTGLVGMTVNFDGVSDYPASPNKGCGAGQQYVVMIDGSACTPDGGASLLNYTSDASYSLVYTNLPVSQSSDVTVYLQTTDTNPDGGPYATRDGESATAPYIANVSELSLTSYDVYTNGNTDQSMNFTWTSPATSSWSVDYYNFQYSDDNGATWTTDASTNSTSYTFDAATFIDASNTTVLLSFRVQAIMVNISAVIYTITSNTVTEYTFAFATAVEDAILNWSVSDPSNSTMDVNVTFKNPTYLGINDGLTFFNVKVFDNLGNMIPYANQNPNYDPSANTYSINFNGIDYSPSGTVAISPYTANTNTGSTWVTNDAYKITLYYITDSVPVFLNIDSSAGYVTGNIVSNNLLKPVAAVTYPNQANTSLITENFVGDASGNIDGVTLNYEQQPNDEYYYTFSIDISVFFPGPYVPSYCVLSCANNAGVSKNGFVAQINP